MLPIVLKWQGKAMATFNEHDLDALLYPTSSALPAQVGNSQGAGNANRLSPYSGFPAISVPAGFSDNGLPVGLELLGKEFDEPTLIKLAYAYQEGTNHRKAPELK